MILDLALSVLPALVLFVAVLFLFAGFPRASRLGKSEMDRKPHDRARA